MLERFIAEGGFKLLTVARLSSGAYSLVCYLLNALAAGAEEVVAAPGELSVLLGLPERSVKQATSELEDCGIISVAQGTGGEAKLLRLVLDLERWKNLRKPEPAQRRTLGDASNLRSLLPQLARPEPAAPSDQGNEATESSRAESGEEEELSGQDALMFPASRHAGEPRLRALIGGLSKVPQEAGSVEPQAAEPYAAAISQIVQAFLATRGDNGLPGGIGKESHYARLLAENQALDQVLALIRHFGGSIPSLALLAGAWNHYEERFQRAIGEASSFDDFRKKHEDMVAKVRSLAAAELKRMESGEILLGADEELLLRIFTRHANPRRQLYWALRIRERYPRLQLFFSKAAELSQAP